MDKKQCQVGARARVRTSEAEVEVLVGPGRVAAGGFYVEGPGDINIPACWARDLSTSQISVYRLEDLELIDQA